MTKTNKVLLVLGAYAIGYFIWKKFKKPPTVLVSGSDKSTPNEVEYATGKESFMGSDGSLDDMINLKKPIYLRPTNLIPNVYDRGIGSYVNCSGGSNNEKYVGFIDDLKTNCNPSNVKILSKDQIDLPKLP